MMSEKIQAVQQGASESSSKTQAIAGTSDPCLIAAQGISRGFVSGERAVFFALREVSLRVGRGTALALVGPSGSGKSTLLNLLAGLDRPTSGQLVVEGLDLIGRSEDEISRHRGSKIGVVFQFFQLLPTLTALENILLPMQLSGHVPRSQRRARALELLERFSVADQADKFPMTLSGGQQQRVAVARALANDPTLVLADEPTGNLDSRTADQVLELLSQLTQSGVTVIMATHESRFLPLFHRVITLADGRILDDSRKEQDKVAAAQGAATC